MARIEDYSKEVLVKYIKDRCFYKTSDFEKIKNDLEFNKLRLESEKIREKMRKLHGIEHIEEYCKLMDKDNVINKKIDKLLGLDKKEGA